MNPFTTINESFGMPHFYLPNIGFSEILEIIILTTLIYYIVRWIRQTHAWSLLKGIIIVVLVALAAYMFDLVTVIWVVQNTFAMGLIALVILFQPELRKALEQIGRGVDLSGFADNKEGASSHTLDEIIQAVTTMSSKRTGALICIEEGVTLDDIAETGTSIDALVSRQLIMNIFTDRTPLHDGAVIIRNNRILAAACILPLTAEDVDSELGTRHRAAMGVSEVSDALIIVVSEETGSISVAQAGKLTRHLSEKGLRDLLNAEFADEAKRRLIPWKNRKI